MNAPVDRPASALPASGTQAGMWFLNRSRPDVPLYVVPMVLRLTGPVDTDAVRRVLLALPARHEALTLRFAPGPRGAVLLPTREGPDITVVDLRDRATPEAAWQTLLEEHLSRPHDLSRQAGYRALFVSLGEHHHMLALFLHHAFVDARSAELILQDLLTELGCQSAAPPGAPVPYRRVAEWLRDSAAGPEREESRDHWKRELSDVADFRLPTDHHRPEHRSFAAAGLRRPLPAGFLDRLKRFCRAERCTPFMALASVYATALATWAGFAESATPVMSVPQTLRREEWLADVVGPLVTSVPLRIPVDGSETFRELLGTARRQATAAMVHCDIGYDEILASSGRTGSGSAPPVTAVAFQVSEDLRRRFRAGDLTVEYLVVHPPVVDLDLKWDVRMDTAGGWLLAAYATELFRPETVERMADEFLALADGLIASPDVPLHRIPFRGTEDVARDWTDGEGAPLEPSQESVDEVFRRTAAARPEATAVVDATGTWTYARLDAAAERIAERLSQAGVSPGSVVALALPRGRGAVASMLGVLRTGAAYLPLDLDQPIERVRAAVTLVRPTAVLTDTATAGTAAALGPPVVTVPTADEPPARPSRVRPRPKTPGSAPADLCYVMSTSGTTGEPKAVEITHRGVVSLAWRPSFAPLDADDVVLQVAPTHFDASTFEIWGALLNGATLVVAPTTRLTGPELTELVRRHGVTTLHLTAGLLRVVSDGHEECFSGLRTLLTGGDVVPVEPVRRILTAFPGLRVVACYGPTENTTFSMVEVVRGRPDDVVPLGTPLPGRSAHLLDPWLRPVPPGATGEIHVGGVGLARGYLGASEKTSTRFVPHPARPGELLYRTGDLARRLPDGTWQFLGRRDHQVKIRGVRVEPAEVESALLRHPDVQQCVVRTRGEAGSRSLAAYAVTRSGTRVEALREHLQGILPSALVPTAYVLLDALPLTAQGKVDTRRLDALPPTVEEAPAQAPLGATEAIVHRIWCAELGLDSVPAHTDFFAVGGHSLAALAIAGRLEQALDRRVPVTEVLRHSTVRALARWLDSSSSAPDDDRPRPPRPSRQRQRSVVHEKLTADLAVATDEELAMLQRLVPGCATPRLTEGPHA